MEMTHWKLMQCRKNDHMWEIYICIPCQTIVKRCLSQAVFTAANVWTVPNSSTQLNKGFILILLKCKTALVFMSRFTFCDGDFHCPLLCNLNFGDWKSIWIKWMLVNWAQQWTLTWNSKHYLAANICLECVSARKIVNFIHWTALWRGRTTKSKQIIQCKQCLFSTQTNANQSMNKKSFINNLSWPKMPM